MTVFKRYIMNSMIMFSVTHLVWRLRLRLRTITKANQHLRHDQHLHQPTGSASAYVELGVTPSSMPTSIIIFKETEENQLDINFTRVNNLFAQQCEADFACFRHDNLPIVNSSCASPTLKLSVSDNTKNVVRGAVNSFYV